jgi:hypothetical protein
MELKAKVIAVLPLVTGQGKNGEWRKQEFVVEIPDGQFPKKVCLSLWGDKIVPLSIGQSVTVQFDVESREYNGRWFTECRAWKVETAQHPAQPATQNVQEQFNQEQGGGDQLPF